MILEDITPLVLTYNEAPNIARCLERLQWAEQVVVLDSHSVDETKDLACSYSNVAFHERRFDVLAKQWNYGVSLVDTEWVLALDADYLVPPDFVKEVAALDPRTAWGFAVRFTMLGLGANRLRASLYPPRTVLHPATASYEQDGHAQRLMDKGPIHTLSTRLDHDDRKSLQRWLTNQHTYAALEAHRLIAQAKKSGTLRDRIRRMPGFTAIALPLYLLILRRGIRDGPAGIYYALQRGVAEALISLRYLEMKHGRTDQRHNPAAERRPTTPSSASRPPGSTKTEP